MGQFTERQYRHGDETIYEDQSFEQVLRGLVLADLSYGAQIMSVTPTRIETRCDFMGLDDRLVIEGAEEDMAFLVRIVQCHLMLVAMQATRDQIVNASVRDFEAATSTTPLNPLLGMALADLLSGGRFTRAALIAALNPATETEARALATVTVQDLVAAIVLHVRDSVPVEEIAALAA